MGDTVPFGLASAREIERQKQVRPDEIVSAGKVGPVCKVIWPFKTAAHVATIISGTERHASRILAGEFDAPGPLIAAIIVELTTRR